MIDINKLDPQVLAIMRDTGWSPTNGASAQQLRLWGEQIRSNGDPPMHAVALEIVSDLGAITLTPEFGPDEMHGIRIDPTLLGGQSPALVVYEKMLGTKLSAIGESYPYTQDLFASEDGAIYMIADADYCVATCIEEALNVILLNKGYHNVLDNPYGDC